MFVDDFGEEQWRDVINVSGCVFTNSGRRGETPVIFCAVNICIRIYFNFRARPYGHPSGPYHYSMFNE